MDEQRQRIIEDLTGALSGEIRCDALTAGLYSTDGGLYQITPLGVAFPRDTADVVTLAQYSDESGIPLIPRGAGTGLTGAAIGAGIVVDFSRHMNDVLAVDEKTVRVQPGVVRDRLNAVLARYGRYFPPDPSNSAITTIGGMLAVDAAGSRSIRVGSTRDHVQSLETVVAGGRLFDCRVESLEALRKRPLTGDGPVGTGTDRDLQRTVVSKLAKILADNAELITKRQPALVRNCSGYFLRGVLNGDRLNLPRLLVGSEGTLGMFVEATLHTSPLPEHRGVVLLLFGEMEGATRAIPAIVAQQPSACDLLDRRLLSLARESDPRFAELISPAAEAGLIVEQTGFGGRQTRDRLRMVIDAVHAVNIRAVVAREAYTPEDVEFLWALPSKVVRLLTRLKGSTRPQPFVEDIAVPPESLHEFLVAAQRVFQKHQVTASLYSHAAAGQVHLRPFLPSPTPRDGSRLESIARDLYQAVFAVGGTISGEHGDGLSRTAFIRSQYGPLYTVFREIKTLFDPHNLMNPGKIISDDPHVTLRNIRPAPQKLPETVELNLRWDSAGIVAAAERCNGCGTCKTQSADMRMCPFFRIDQAEASSPRAKANVIRNVCNGQLDPWELSMPGVKELADLCFNCKQCQLECPSNVDIPQMMIEAKAAYVAANGLRRSDWVLSRAHSFGAFGSVTSPVTNWAIGNRYARWWMEKVLGIARQRKLPRFARRTFLRSMDRGCRRMPSPSEAEPTVVYFVSEYANYYDPELAHALVAVFRHNGIRVFVPPGQTTSGMAMITAGDVTAAREVAEQNVRELAELAREGFPIVCSEPSAAVCLRQEYPKLLDHPDVDLVASRVVEAGEYLERLAQEGKLNTSFSPLELTAGYHTPCHQKALGDDSPLLRLLALIPGLTVRTIDEGCSGMAGAFGLTRDNFATSVRIGWGLISRMRDADLQIGTTECSSCKMQMEQGTSTPTLHPLKLLALAYGLMPEIRQKLQPSKHKLVVT